MATASGKAAMQLELERLRASRVELARANNQMLASIGQSQPRHQQHGVGTTPPGGAEALGRNSSAPSHNGRARSQSVQAVSTNTGPSPAPAVTHANAVDAAAASSRPAGIAPLPIERISGPPQLWPASAPSGTSDPWAADGMDARSSNASSLSPRQRSATTGRLNRFKDGVARKGSASLMRVSTLVGKPARASNEITVPHQQQLHTGWLYKEGDFGFQNGFARRYFVLYTMQLQYFKDDPALTEPRPRPNGGIKLANAQIVDMEPATGRGQMHCFRLDLSQPDAHLRKRYMLAAESAAQKVEWMTQIRAAVAAIETTEMDEESLKQAAYEQSMFEGAEFQIGSKGNFDSRGSNDVAAISKYIQSLTPSLDADASANTDCNVVVSGGASAGTPMPRPTFLRDIGTLMDQGSFEPQPEQDRSVEYPRSPATDSARLCEVLRKPFSLQSDCVTMVGWLSIVRQTENWKSKAFIGKKKKKSRATRQSAYDAVDETAEFYVELSGLDLKWFDGHGPGRVLLGHLRLDVGAKIAFHPTIANVVLIPGHVLSARELHKTVEWALALTFNTYAAKLARKPVGSGDKDEDGDGQEELYVANYEADPAEVMLRDPKGSNIRFDALYNHPGREGRLTLAVEVIRGQRPGKGEREMRLFESMNGSSPLHIKLWLRLPVAVSTGTKGSKLKASESHRWERMFETEAAPAKEFAPGCQGISFSVMLSIDPWVILDDGTKLESNDLKLRLGLCNSKDTMLGTLECTVNELQQKSRLVHVLSTAWDGALSDGSSLMSHQVHANAFSVGSSTSDGVTVGVTAYTLPCKQDVNQGFHDISMQSYMLPIVSVAIAATASPLRRFEDEPLVGPCKNNAVIATERLVLPKPLSVPIQYLTHAMTSLRKQLIDDIESVCAAPPHAQDSGILDVLDGDDDDDDRTFSNAALTTLQQKMKMAIEVLPVYERCCTFYLELLRKHGHQSSVDATRDLYYKQSIKRKQTEWAFMATNMMMYSLEVSELPGLPATSQSKSGTVGSDLVPHLATKPLIWLSTSGAAAAHNYKFKKGGIRRLNSQLHAANNKIVQAHISKSGSAVQGGPEEPGQMPRTETLVEIDVTMADSAQAELVVLSLDKEKRMDCVLSQAISIVVANFLGMFQNAHSCGGIAAAAVNPNAYHLRWLRLLERTGKFLVHVESLLSTWRNELGMIEDLYASVFEGMNSVTFRCINAGFDGMGANSCTAITKEGTVAGNGERVVVTISLSLEYWRLIPASLLGKAPGTVFIDVVATLFTQGVNEQQTLAHKFKPGDQGVQDEINAESLKLLQQFHDTYKSCSVSSTINNQWEVPGEPDWRQLDELLATATNAIESAHGIVQKQAAVLLQTQKYTLQLGAGRVTHCKSGKDRTGMSSSLEVLVAIQDELQQGGFTLIEDERVILDTLRRHGVRRENVRLNTGTDRYAFNALQMNFLPEEYKPPAGSYGKLAESRTT